MIRTGRRLDQPEGEQLLHYTKVVKTSGRHRREHLAWELMVALGPFAGEPATLVDRYGIPPSGVRDVLVDHLSEIKAGMAQGLGRATPRRDARRRTRRAVHRRRGDVSPDGAAAAAAARCR